MDILKEFEIPFRGLQDGLHEMEYHLRNNFFSVFDKPLITDADVNVQVELDRRPSMMILDIEFSGDFPATCDRCLNDIRIPISGEHQLIIKFIEGESNEDDVIYLDDGVHVLNIAQYLYECIIVAIPLSKVRDCETDEYKYCNKEVLDRLTLDVSDEEDTQTKLGNALKELNIKPNN